MKKQVWLKTVDRHGKRVRQLSLFVDHFTPQLPDVVSIHFSGKVICCDRKEVSKVVKPAFL